MTTRVDVESRVTIYEIDGDETEGPTLHVKNHWNMADFVVLSLNNKKITVVARDLEVAIKNATNR